MQRKAHSRLKEKRRFEKKLKRLKLSAFILGVLLLIYITTRLLANLAVFSPIQAATAPGQEPIYVEKPVDRPVPVFEPSTEAVINYYAQKYGVKREQMECTLKHESGFRKNATNGTSTATGMAQILEGTWKGWRHEMGEDPDPNLRFDGEESIKTMAWAFSKGKQTAWEAFKSYCQ